MTMEKPYIKLDQDYPGIVSLFMFDREVAKNLSAMAETVMRRPRGLTQGERELIAAYVSKLNECQFCYRSHRSCAEEMNDIRLITDLLDKNNLDSDHLTDKMLHLLMAANCVQAGPADHSGRWSALPIHIQRARNMGATDEEIHDAVLVASFFSMCNRYVDGLGTTFKYNEPEQGGRSLAYYGYKMGIRRFLAEVFPKLWSRFWG